MGNCPFIHLVILYVLYVFVGFVPYSCNDGSRLWTDWRDITLFDGIHSIPEVRSSLVKQLHESIFKRFQLFHFVLCFPAWLRR